MKANEHAEKLRARAAGYVRFASVSVPDLNDAADEINRLEAENERLRTEVASPPGDAPDGGTPPPDRTWPTWFNSRGDGVVMEWTIYVPPSGASGITIGAMTGNARGMYDVLINGVCVGWRDWYAANEAIRLDTIEGFWLEPGEVVTIGLRHHIADEHGRDRNRASEGNTAAIHTIAWLAPAITYRGNEPMPLDEFTPAPPDGDE